MTDEEPTAAEEEALDRFFARARNELARHGMTMPDAVGVSIPIPDSPEALQKIWARQEGEGAA